MNFHKFIAVVVYTKRSFFHLDDFFYCLATLTFQLGLTNASSVDQKRPCCERTTSSGTPTHSSYLRESFLGKTHLLILFSIYSLFQLQLQYTVYTIYMQLHIRYILQLVGSPEQLMRIAAVPIYSPIDKLTIYGVSRSMTTSDHKNEYLVS